MNKSLLIGRLTRDVHYSQSDGGTSVARFTLAIDRYKKGGEKKTNFVPVVAFGKTAENVNKYLSKGSPVGVEGHIETGSYEKKDGTTVYTTEVWASNVEFLGQSKKKDEGEDGYYENKYKDNQYEQQGFTSVDEDDIPF